MNLESYLEELLYKIGPSKSNAEIDEDITWLIEHGIGEHFARVLAKHHRRNLAPIIQNPVETNTILGKWYAQLLVFCRKNGIRGGSADIFLDIGMLYKYIHNGRLSCSDCQYLSTHRAGTWREALKNAERIKVVAPYLSDRSCKQLAMHYFTSREKIIKVVKKLRKTHPDWSQTKLARETMIIFGRHNRAPSSHDEKMGPQGFEP